MDKSFKSTCNIEMTEKWQILDVETILEMEVFTLKE